MEWSRGGIAFSPYTKISHLKQAANCEQIEKRFCQFRRQMKLISAFLVLCVFAIAFHSSDAEAKKRRRKKDKEPNPDIRCRIDSQLNSERELVEVRLEKMLRKRGGKSETIKISGDAGEKICNSISQVLWKKLVEGKGERNCSDPLKIYVRGKNHKICLDESEKPALEMALKEVDASFQAN